jgi:hypothetical protein
MEFGKEEILRQVPREPGFVSEVDRYLCSSSSRKGPKGFASQVDQILKSHLPQRPQVVRATRTNLPCLFPVFLFSCFPVYKSRQKPVQLNRKAGSCDAVGLRHQKVIRENQHEMKFREEQGGVPK